MKIKITQNVFLPKLGLFKFIRMASSSQNAMKSSGLAEHLVNNTCCGNSYDTSKFSLMKQCSAILIHLNQSNICNKKEFVYTLALFS